MSVQKNEEKVEISSTSQKGQITIPKKVRDELDVKKGTKFAIYGSGDTIVMKKVSVPSKKDFEELVDWGTDYARRKGIGKEEVLEDD